MSIYVRRISLLFFSTEPDGTLALPFKKGAGGIDCCSRHNLPLASDMATPNLEWLCQESELATLTVCPSDIYHSDLAPQIGRCLLAVDHESSIIVNE